MRVFIVHAHHEPASFNGALTSVAVDALVAAGHEVVVSDLYAAGFDPVSDRRNFTTVKRRDRLRQQDEEEHASATNGYVPELQAEMDRLAWCDVLVLQFPLWWLGMPAILKGWVDRVFAVGRAYGGGRFFSRGVFRGRRAMCSVTVGGPAEAYGDRGVYGSLDAILRPIHLGILAFAGFDVLDPFVVYAPSRMEPDARAAELRAYAARVVRLRTDPVRPMPDMSRHDGLVLRSASDP